MAFWFTSDWHGIKEFYPEVKKIIKPEDTVIFGGDANDRGPDGWELIKTLLKDDQFIYIRGNHEQMLIDATRNPQEEALLYCNGGQKTFMDWESQEMNEEWIKYLDKMTTFQFAYTNAAGQLIYITHSGYWGVDNYEKLWNREHTSCDWETSGCDIIVHGHTPICYIAQAWGDRSALAQGDSLFNKEYWYCDNRKCCVDVASYHTRQTILLNLDTWESILIKV